MEEMKKGNGGRKKRNEKEKGKQASAWLYVIGIQTMALLFWVVVIEPLSPDNWGDGEMRRGGVTDGRE